MSNERHDASNNRQFDCVFLGLFILSLKTSKLRIIGILWGFISQRASNTMPCHDKIMVWTVLSFDMFHMYID